MSSEENIIEPTNRDFNLKDSVLSTTLPYRLLAHKKGLYFDLHYTGKVPETLIGDYKKIEKVIEILTDNSIRYTDIGGVKINISCTFNPEHKEEVILKISIADTGRGIDSALEQMVEQPGELFLASGLSIAIGLIQAMNGKIRVIRHSNFQKLIGGPGTTFWFTLNLKADTNSKNIIPSDKSAWMSSESLDILLVDDNPVVRKLVGLILEDLQCKVTCAISGEDALSKNIAQFDLILMDVQMPKLNGLETTREIRCRGLNIPIIGITALASVEDIEGCLDSGMDDFVAKPIDREQLRKKILKWAGDIQRPDKVKKENKKKRDNVDSFSPKSCDGPTSELVLIGIKEQINHLSKILIAIHEEKWEKIESFIGSMKSSLKLEVFYSLAEALDDIEKNYLPIKDMEGLSYKIQEAALALEKIYKSAVLMDELMTNDSQKQQY